MRAALLHLDEALHQQPQLTARVAADGGTELDLRRLGPALRLWSRPPALERLGEALREQLPAGEGPVLAFCGSGDFHHVTPLLLARAIEVSGCAEVTVLHFDNHPDWVRFANGAHCGSWVGWAARLRAVARVITVGVCSRDVRRPSPRRADLGLLTEGRLEIYPYADPDGADAVDLCGRAWPTIEAMGEAAFTEFLPSRIPTEAIYVTVDKDVLRADDAATNWDQGRASLDFLTRMLVGVLQHHRLIGADIVGDWSSPAYGGGLMASVLKQGEALLDQPWSRPGPHACAANARANLEFLELFAGASR